jgi:hypothetical protein
MAAVLGCGGFWTGIRRQRLFLLVKGSLANLKHDERLDRVLEALRSMGGFCGPEQKAVIAGHTGAALLDFYGVTEDLSHLDDAVTLLREAGEPDPLIAALRLRYARTRQAYDLEEAIRLEARAVQRSEPVPAETVETILKLLTDLTDWTLPPGGWTEVDGELTVLQSALESGDADAAAAAVVRLAHMAPLRVGRLGEEPLPPPRPIRERINRLIHALDADGDTDGTPTEDADEPE